MCPLRAVNCGAALAIEAQNLMAQTHNVTRIGYCPVRACVRVCVTRQWARYCLQMQLTLSPR